MGECSSAGTSVLSVMGAPSRVGAYGPGQENTPAAFREHDLLGALSRSGREVIDRGDGPIVAWQQDEEHPAAANASLVGGVARVLADSVAKSLSEGHDVLILGGDCSIELGTVSGALRDGSRVALAYIDLDSDLNTPATADGILDWMGVAHILGVPGTLPELASLAGHIPMLRAADVRLFGAKNITEPERDLIHEQGIHIEPLEAITGEPGNVLARTRDWAAEYDRLLIHVDFDVLDYERFPIAENTGIRGGLSLDALGHLITDLLTLPNFRALTLTEINREHAPDEQHSFTALIDMLTTALTLRSL